MLMKNYDYKVIDLLYYQVYIGINLLVYVR